MRRCVLTGVMSLFVFLQPLGASATSVAVFAPGCFWCLEDVLSRIDGVTNVVNGYSGGSAPDPTYDQIASDTTGHAEAVRVTFDETRVSYRRLLLAFWFNIDPTDPDGQFCSRGSHHRTVIFVQDAEQRATAEMSLQRIEMHLGRKIVTEIQPAGDFWLAEPFHQNYASKNPLRYEFFVRGCGREDGLRQIWRGMPTSTIAP